MQKAQLAKYRRRLEREYKDLQALLSRQEQAMRAADDGAPEDSAAQAAKTYSKEFFYHQSDSGLTQLAQVEQALRRIDSAEFGICESCGRKIERKRLDAVPWTRYCRNCQELEEELNIAEKGPGV